MTQGRREMQICYHTFAFQLCNSRFRGKGLAKDKTICFSVCVFWKSLPTCGTSVFSIVKKADSWRNCPKRLLFNIGALRPRLKNNSNAQVYRFQLMVCWYFSTLFFLCVVIVVHILVCRCIAANLRKSVDVALWTSQKLLRLRFSSVYFYKLILFLSTFDCKQYFFKKEKKDLVRKAISCKTFIRNIFYCSRRGRGSRFFCRHTSYNFRVSEKYANAA